MRLLAALLLCSSTALAQTCLVPENASGALADKSGKVITVPAWQLRTLVTAKERISKVAGVDACLLMSPSDVVGAVANETGGRYTIMVAVGVLSTFGDSPDVMAAIMAHELAHIAKRHVAARESARMTAMAYEAFIRDQELEADTISIEWLRRAGYDPRAAVRLHAWAEVNQKGGVTHPTSKERVANLERLLAE